MVLEVYQLSRLASPDMSQALSYFWCECRQCCRARPLSFPGTILRLQSSDSVKRLQDSTLCGTALPRVSEFPRFDMHALQSITTGQTGSPVHRSLQLIGSCQSRPDFVG